MKWISTEKIAVLLTLVGLGAAVAWPFAHEAATAGVDGNREIPVITITGLAETGTWTDLEVRAGNYFAKEFPAARPVLRVGEPTLLRIKSVDVLHKFYSPELGIGPLEVYPGHVEEVLVTPTEAGSFDFYCTTVCGRPHFGMRGRIVVRPARTASEELDDFWLEPEPEDVSLVARGAWLFRQNGCFNCHGVDGHGGVRDPNYIKDQVPALDVLAERMYLYYPEDIQAIVDLLEKRVPLDQVAEDPPVMRYRAVLAKYQSIKELLRRGNPAGKKDPEGPEPPLSMPTWGQRLTDSDLDALIAYLLTMKPMDPSQAELANRAAE